MRGEYIQLQEREKEREREVYWRGRRKRDCEREGGREEEALTEGESRLLAELQ